MCLYPRLIQNPKYRPSRKNGWSPPPVPDDRVKYVPIACQYCLECRKQKARQWSVRLQEDIKTHKDGKFITLTFSNEHYAELNKLIPNELQGYDKDNAIATLATRRFLERWRKTHGRSLRHWWITELGHEGTENIHIHGIVWTENSYETIRNHWQYGYIWPKDEKTKTWVNTRTINYLVKYVNKIDEEHQTYQPIILTSAGIGHNYTNSLNAQANKFNGKNTRETYRTPNGQKLNLPIYWRNKIYTEQERERLWLHRLDKQERWICGEKISIAKNDKAYWAILKHYQKRSQDLGYQPPNWERIAYEKSQRALKQLQRIKNAEKRAKRPDMPQTACAAGRHSTARGAQ